MAKQLIGSFEQKWDPSRLEDTYRDRVMELIHKKARGEEIVREEAPEPQGEVIDLMQALKDSLSSSRKTAGKGAGRAPAGKRKAARRASSRKAGKGGRRAAA
jgi:DNA end-binding protein Ku